jgi:4-carboxymuconolactone decarboxylase
MSADTDPALRQGGTTPWRERLPLPAREQMNDEQRAAAQALIDGPRKGVFGPFLPLLRAPQLLDRVAALGETLRFKGSLEARIRELAICAASRHVGNQFEWHMHAPLAVQAGVSAAAIDLLRQGARPQPLATDEAIAYDACHELLHTNGVSDPTYQRAVEQFGEPAVVELVTLVGYFVMVSWLMNVAHTPAQKSAGAALPAFPA